MRRITVALLITAAGLNAQAQPAFEVASIRLNEDVNSPSVSPGLRNGTLTGRRVTLRRLLAVAYRITEPQVIGPDWLERNRFDIVAKSPPGVPDSERGPMLQALLRERFKLSAHLDTKVMTVYHLVVGPNGVRMPVYPVRNTLGDDPSARGFPMMVGTGTVAQLAENLSFVLAKPVIDRTELKERYNYFLSYAPISAEPREQAAEFGPPDIFTAIQKQMGLKLEPAKDGVRVLVVDHVERLPIEN